MSENTKEKSIKTFQLKFKKRIESAIFFYPVHGVRKVTQKDLKF